MRPYRLKADDLVCAAIAALVVALLNLSFLSKGYVLEGMARAIPIELGQFHSLFYGNYILYGFLGDCFHHLLKAFGYTGLAVDSLIIMDGFIGAGGVFVFFLILRCLESDYFSAFAWCAVLAFSLGYWHWSTEAEDYIFSTFLLTLNFLFLLLYYLDAMPRSPVLLGVLHTLAVMGHIINGIFAPVTLWFLYRAHGRSWKNPAFRYLSAFAVSLSAVYSFVLVFVVRARNWPQALSWILGDAGIPGMKTPAIHWHGAPSRLGLGLWIKQTLHIFVSFGPSFLSPPAWRLSRFLLPLAWALLAIHGAAIVIHRRRIVGNARTAAVACCLWMLMYALVFTSWEPGTMVYRVSDLVPLCLLLFLGYRSWPASEGKLGSAVPRALAAAFAACLCVGNLGSEISPLSYASNNPRLAHMAFLKEHTPPGAWIAGEGGDEINIPYFAERKPIQIVWYAQNRAGLQTLIDRLLRDRQRVFVTSAVLNDSSWEKFLKPYRPALTALGADGYGCYELSLSS